MKIWIDDCRPAPKGYKWHKSVNTAKRFIMEMELMNKPFHSAPIEVIDMDHDAGDFASDGGDYIELLNWLEIKQNCYNWTINSMFKIHSMNVVGVQNMRAIIQHNGWKEVI